LTFWVSHLVQTQVVGRKDILIKPVLSMYLGAPGGIRHATVVDSVAVRSSRFNRVQQLAENQRLKTNGLQRGFQLENLVPNRISGIIEIY
jgi:hypothetical protein